MTTLPRSPLWERLVEAGGIPGEYHARVLIRHFGDPTEEYRAATTASAVMDRSHRTRLRVAGKAPVHMLKGVLTGVMPALPVELREGVWAGRGTYHAVLTPKGKMITDLWAYLMEDERAGLLLDAPVAGTAGLTSTLERVLPPRFASWEDVTSESAMITVVGPDAAGELSRSALGLRVDAEELQAMGEGAWRVVAPPSKGLVVAKTSEVWPDAYSVLGPTGPVGALWDALVSAGVSPSGHATWSTLRVEAGRPVFGTDMDERTIPTEAGIDTRAIDHTKGCYTGQEVIVRIRDRGHVNRTLRLLELGDLPIPAPGTELSDATGKPAGVVTSAVLSPRAGGVLALAYVTRDAGQLIVDGRLVEVPDP